MAVGDRGAFLQDVAAALQGQDLGDGAVYRVVAQVQRRYYDPSILYEPRWGSDSRATQTRRAARARLAQCPAPARARPDKIRARHAILCGDSATFQGTERDIVFLSMVADPKRCTALTMLRYEQRFNVAVSRARDRLVLVRSVRREELNPDDLKARLIAHFENPMPLEPEATGNALDVCDSAFERDLMQRLLDRGFRVRPQVGSLGFRIDLVVEGAHGRRLAVECDGDRFHGPQQWREDMRRQRVLERVGWRFWRCFASSYYGDTDRVMADLFDTLSRMGIEPVPKDETARPSGQFTEHRIVGGPERASVVPASSGAQEPYLDTRETRDGIAVGDNVVVAFGDDQRRISLRLTEGTHDFEKGFLSRASALGKVISGAEEGDEIEFEQDDGRRRKVLIETVDRGSVPPSLQSRCKAIP